MIKRICICEPFLVFIAKDVQDLFGDDCKKNMPRHSMIVSSRPVVKTSLPMKLYDILTMVPDLPANNPYNRLLTAIELMEMNDDIQD